MKTRDRIKRAIRNPKLLTRGINRLYHRRAGLRSENIDGIDVFEEDWDNLVVLDACRYDMFAEINEIEGRLSSKISKASATAEWLRVNVDGIDLSDTVYVTANPQLERHREQWDVNFHEVVNVWLDEGWDEETGTVLADTMTERALEVYKRFPNKRLVVHYMQPHYPFVPADTEFDKKHLSSIEDRDDGFAGENIWNQKFMGELDITREELWNIYAENLVYVLDHIEDLLSGIDGKTIITSDHGNYVGDRASPIPIREYGHPRGMYDDSIVTVPWLEHTSGERRRIVSDSSTSGNSDIDSTTVSNRLQNLGYLQ
jgi:hypothetical protein